MNNSLRRASSRNEGRGCSSCLCQPRRRPAHCLVGGWLAVGWWLSCVFLFWRTILVHPRIEAADCTIVAMRARGLLFVAVGLDPNLARVNLLPVLVEKAFDKLDQP